MTDEAGRTGGRVTGLADAYLAGLLRRYPELGTRRGIPGADHGAITDPSIEALARWHAREDAWLGELSEIDDSALDGRREGIVHGLLLETLEVSRRCRVCRGELWSVDQLRGWQVEYPVLAAVQPVGTNSLREAVLRRFGALPDHVDILVENLREGLRLGYSSPRLAVDRVLGQVEGLLEGATESSPFFSPAKRDPDVEFQEALRRRIEDGIRPAVERYRDFLRDEYLPSARTEIALSANPDGAEAYRALLRAATSLEVSPEEIHALGVEKMDSLTEEMTEIARRSFGTQDLTSLFDRLRSDEAFLFTSREEIQESAENALARARAAMPAWFGVLPAADVVVEPFPPHEEASAPAGQYVSPSQEGGRPGKYRINLFHAEAQPRAPLESIAFHETIPGHHLQIAIAQELADAHPMSRYLWSMAYGEGWATYSERLSDEMGLFSSDLDRLGMLSNLAFRAARLVVDTGIHAFGWSRDRAIDYMAEHTAENREQIATEVDRYIVMPGQATSYMVGYEEMTGLRRYAERELGSAFDIAGFHDAVLGDGAVPLPMLKTKIERWVETSR